MHKMSNLEYSFIVRELALPLNGKHFGRIRKVHDGIYRMKIAGIEVICELGVRIHSTRYIEPAESDKFTEKVEKELDNARLLEIKQINNDRIVAFVFDKGELVFEMFGQGNAIFVKGGKTLCAHKYESWSDREIKAGSPYRPPKTAPVEKLEVTEKYIIVSLMKLPLGKEYALEALARAKISEKAPGSSLSGNQILRLEQEISKIAVQANPVAFFKDGKMSEYSLAALAACAGQEMRQFPSLSEAADEYYAHAEKPNPKLEKLLERLEKQKERLALLTLEEKDHRSKGDYIYGKYQEIERLIETARSGRFGELGNAKVDKKERSIEAEV